MAHDDDNPLIQAVNRLFYAALEVRARAGAISIMPCPELPLAAALAMDRPHREAKARTKAVLARLRPACSPEVWTEVLKFEAALREEGNVITDVAFSVGLTGTGYRP